MLAMIPVISFTIFSYNISSVPASMSKAVLVPIADAESPALPSSPEVNERVLASSTGGLACNGLLPSSSVKEDGDGTLHLARMDLNGLGSCA